MDEEREHGFMVAVFSVAAGMVGVCLTGISLLQVVTSVTRISTLADELLAIDAVLFLGCALVCFVSFRVRTPNAQRRFRKAADALLFTGLITMVVICSLIAWTLV